MPRKTGRQSDRLASKGFPNPIDVWVGKRIRERRVLTGHSQTALANALGITFQQVQKYESGANRVSSSRLFDVAKFLGVELSYFFQEMPEDIQHMSPAQLRDADERGWMKKVEDGARAASDKPIFKRETMEFVRAYSRIRDHQMRAALRNMVMRIAQSETKGENGKPTAPFRAKHARAAIEKSFNVIPRTQRRRPRTAPP